MVSCELCVRYFGSSKDFASFNGLEQHWIQSSRHHYCQYCQYHLDTVEDLAKHARNGHAWCAAHRRVFVNDRELHEHYRRQHHFELVRHHSDDHYYCEDCDTFFQSQSNLKEHLNSSRHRVATIPCPSARCGRFFIKFSDLVQHVEAGTCPSGIEPETLDEEVIYRDKDHIITNPERWATERSWNGSAYECTLCTRDFRTLRSLNQHLQSSAHTDQIYRCWNRSCGSVYAALSSLVQHIESDRCGVRRFKKVKNALDEIKRAIQYLTRTLSC
ncbi:hypothetical protein K488DRAFT_77732 [Vararia minispora EC-137]|uniref:Uncharacterized protein n=1 Tax=Vararia minispora EC-137 TaxID=1314806 RepID=A0ACB8QQ88_9AGAM|nr:hypothetical protein K488DRAFT_77732 [Vararia minispora EC-137]